MGGNQFLEGFEVEEVMGSQYDAEQDRVYYLIQCKGYPERSDWTEEPLEYLPRAIVKEFHRRHPEAAMDTKLIRKVRR